MVSFSEYLKQNEQAAKEVLGSEDYRSFMRCFFQIKKELNPTYSYAVFARQAKVSKSLPRDIIEGLKRITDKTLPSFIKAMELEGLLSAFFVQLVSSDDDLKKKRILKQLASLFIETHFTKTFTDSNFKDYRSPFLYAASGEVDKGVSLETLSKRTGLNLEAIQKTLPSMEQLRLGRFNAEQGMFIPATSHVHVESEESKNFFSDFYLFCLKLQTENVTSKFNAEENLFYNEVFSINAKDLPKLKAELMVVLKSHLIKAENPHGDSVAVFNLGLFKQLFDKHSSMNT